MKQSLVGVIIPTHNRGPLLDEAIRSVLAQTYQPLEVIVVDDGSTDDTRERVLTYGPSVRYIYQSNRGPAAARNTGIAHSRGEYIAFLDDDDIWLPRKLERQVDALAADPDAVVYCRHGYMDQRGNVLPQADRPVVRNPVLAEAFEGRFLHLNSIVVPRSCTGRIGMFDPSLRQAEDWEFLIRVALAGYTVTPVPEVLVLIRLHSDHLSHNYEDSLENHLRVLAKLGSMIPPSRWTVEDKQRVRSRVPISNGCARILDGKWQSGLSLVIEGIRTCPSLLEDPQFYMSLGYYDLRPLGFRGPGMELSTLEGSFGIMQRMLTEILSAKRHAGDAVGARRAWGTYHLVLAWLYGKERQWARSLVHLARAVALDPMSVYHGVRSKLARIQRMKARDRSAGKLP